MTDLGRADEAAAFGPEWALLERLCVGPEEGDTDDRSMEDEIAEIAMSGHLDWGILLEQALRHQMLAMLAYHGLRARRPGFEIPGRVENHLIMSLEANRWRLQVFREEAARITLALDRAGVPFVATKGMTFESTLYRGRGVRTLKDMDLMIREADREATAEALRELGYTPGVFSWASRSIEPHPRKEHMNYVLNPDHLPRHARICDEPTVPYLYVDVANSLTWSKSPYEVSVEEALESRCRIELPGREGSEPVGELPAFAPPFQFLFTVLHLFREAWLEQWVALELDVSLMKFGDVIRLFARDRDELVDGRFAELLEAKGVVEPVAWVLEHMDRTFGTRTAEAIGIAGRLDEDWLRAAHPSYGQDRRWRGTMRERLWAKDREQLFERSAPNS